MFGRRSSYRHRVRGNPERGAASLEAVSAVAVAAVLVLAIVAALPSAQLVGIAQQAVCLVKTQAPCASGDRRDQERQTRDDRRGRGEDQAPGDPGVEGPDSTGDSLGPPVSGTSVSEPQPPPWEPPDAGAGEYDSERAWPWDHGKKVLIEAAANALAGKWPDASRNLSHYLANTGEPLEQDVNRILTDVPLFQARVDELRTSLREDAVERARQSGASGPITFPVSTD